eukprot:TRINITY_DN1581_c0_g1_i1.p1 TRINITY_DN1581_c0_g1~~TRINITY_DN1581_c0_g1_i1.p1  ORF type:complete len:379 (+),score=105.62 TRINITY_DN1581_c0_g1_i1:86-1222(+)
MFISTRVPTTCWRFGKISHNSSFSSNFLPRFQTNSAHFDAHAIQYEKFGTPSRVLKFTTGKVSDEVKGSQVLVRMMAAPIHPADLNIVQGRYPLQPQLPAVPGIEGVGEVIAVGPDATGLSYRDWVVPRDPLLGTWRTHLVCDAKQLRKIPASLPVQAAATMSINPPTAFCLLDEFVKLEAGDVVLQSAGNSTVGQLVAQIAQSRGIKVVSVVRQENLGEESELVARLKKFGATIVVTPEYLRTPKFNELISDLPKPKLALDAVGGNVATDLARRLAPGGTLVSYGAMAKQPLEFPSSLFLFNDIRVKGFWLSQWLQSHSAQEVDALFEKITTLIQQQKLFTWLERHPFESAQAFEFALERLGQVRDRKVYLSMEEIA